MKTAPKFKGRRVDNGIIIEGVPVSSVNDKTYMIVYATEDAINTPNEVDFLFAEVDHATVEQIGVDLFEENKRLMNTINEIRSVACRERGIFLNADEALKHILAMSEEPLKEW